MSIHGSLSTHIQMALGGIDPIELDFLSWKTDSNWIYDFLIGRVFFGEACTISWKG